MRIDRSPMREKGRDQCVREIRNNENRERSHEEESKASMSKRDEDQ
jgi:hypothetical protein